MLDTIYDAFNACMEAVKGLDPEEVEPIICMMIDHTAARRGISSAELLYELAPVIREVNDDLGTMEIA